MGLISELPQILSINNEVYEINTDFRKGIEFEDLFNEELENKEFWDRALKIYYPILDCTINIDEIEKIRKYEYIIENADEAIKQMLWFHRCGRETKTEDTQEEPKEEILSYSHDWELIVGAFKNQYGIDLYEDQLHWWKFKAYFSSLKEDTKIKQIISIRNTNINELSKEQQSHYRKLKKICAIPLSENQLKQKNALEEALMNGGDISKLL